MSNSDPKSANKPKKDNHPDDPSRDENHDESRENQFDEETARAMGSDKPPKEEE
jgi:hypothetical protein